MTAPDDETLRAMLADFATATAKRPPCEARLDPDACDACIAFTTESLEAGVRLWGQARAPGTIKALAAEVLRLRAEMAAFCAAAVEACAGWEAMDLPPSRGAVRVDRAMDALHIVAQRGLR